MSGAREYRHDELTLERAVEIITEATCSLSHGKPAGWCVDNESGRSPFAKYGADKCCDQCILAAAWRRTAEGITSWSAYEQLGHTVQSNPELLGEALRITSTIEAVAKADEEADDPAGWDLVEIGGLVAVVEIERARRAFERALTFEDVFVPAADALNEAKCSGHGPSAEHDVYDTECAACVSRYYQQLIERSYVPVSLHESLRRTQRADEAAKNAERVHVGYLKVEAQFWQELALWLTGADEELAHDAAAFVTECEQHRDARRREHERRYQAREIDPSSHWWDDDLALIESGQWAETQRLKRQAIADRWLAEHEAELASIENGDES